MDGVAKRVATRLIESFVAALISTGLIVTGLGTLLSSAVGMNAHQQQIGAWLGVVLMGLSGLPGRRAKLDWVLAGVTAMLAFDAALGLRSLLGGSWRELITRRYVEELPFWTVAVGVAAGAAAFVHAIIRQEQASDTTRQHDGSPGTPGGRTRG